MNTVAAHPQEKQAEDIREEYRDGAADRAGIRHGVRRLLTECPGMFLDEVHAYSFLTE